MQLFQALAGQLEDSRFFATRMGTPALAAHAQARAQIGLGELLGLEIGQKHLERFHARRRVADRVRQVLLIALDGELGNLGHRAFGTHMAYETVDLACRQLALTGGEIAQVACGCLT